MKKKFIISYTFITLGSLITALGLDMFLVPHQIAAGGASGLATIIYYIFGFPVGMSILAINIPLLLVSIKVLGPHFGLKTIYGIFVLSIFVDLLKPVIVSPTSDALLAAIFGGILTGLGLGIVFRSGGTTGGTDISALLMRKQFKISSGQGLLIVDGLVILTAGIVFSAEFALYALIAVFITSRVIDFVQEGVGAKAALIISNETDDISEAVMSKLGRGATIFSGTGAFTREQRSMVLTVVGRSEISRLKAVVTDADPYAFMIVTSAHEVHGEGFQEIIENTSK